MTKQLSLLAGAAMVLSACIVDDEDGGIYVPTLFGPVEAPGGFRDPYANTGKTVQVNGQTIPIVQRRDKNGKPGGNWLIRVNGTTHTCLGNNPPGCQITANGVAREGDGGHSH